GALPQTPPPPPAAAESAPTDKKEARFGESYSPQMGGGFGRRAALGVQQQREVLKELSGKMDLGKSVTSAASASKLGDYFQYAIDHPVTLPRQKSALLPILGKDVKGERLSIYNEGTHARFPLLGLAFTNTTGMHLTQGPITVYEGGTY